MTRQQIALTCERYANGYTSESTSKILGVRVKTVRKNINKYYLYKVNNPIVIVLESIINNDDKVDYQ